MAVRILLALATVICGRRSEGLPVDILKFVLDGSTGADSRSKGTAGKSKPVFSNSPTYEGAHQSILDTEKLVENRSHKRKTDDPHIGAAKVPKLSNTATSISTHVNAGTARGLQFDICDVASSTPDKISAQAKLLCETKWCWYLKKDGFREYRLHTIRMLLCPHVKERKAQDYLNLCRLKDVRSEVRLICNQENGIATWKLTILARDGIHLDLITRTAPESVDGLVNLFFATLYSDMQSTLLHILADEKGFVLPV